jgi:hypothetical protein
MAKIEVLAMGVILDIAAKELKGVKLFEESHNRVSFVCSEAKFEKIHKAVLHSQHNLFAVMSWQSF